MDLVGLAEIVDLLGVSRSYASQLVNRKGFPDPVADLATGRIWRRTDVEQWARDNGRIK